MKIIVIKGNGNDRSYRLMADSSMLANNKPFFIPDFAPEFVLHPALAVRIDRLGKNIAPRFAHRYYQSASACAVVEAKVEAKVEVQFAHLDARYTAFDGAFMLGKALPITDLDADGGLKVHTQINDDQSLSTSLISTRQIDNIIAEASEYFTLKMGDMIVIGSDNEGHSLSIGEHLSGTINEKDSLTIRIK